MKETVYIYHTNDIHSHLEKWPRISKALRQVRTTHEQNEENIYSFDLGDFTDRAHPLTEATDGKANVRLMNDAQYNAVTIGNNEGVGNTKKQLDELYNDAEYDVVLSNLRDRDSETYPSWADPIKLYKTRKGFTIGVIACTIPLSVSYSPLGWDVEDPFVSIDKMIENYKGNVDFFILLSHLGLNYDREIADLYPIDLIIGAHTHHSLPNGEWQNGTLIAAAGRYGEYVGKIKVELGDEGFINGEAKLIETFRDLHPLREEKHLDELYKQIGHEIMSQHIVADIPKTLQVKWQGDSELVNEGLKAVADYANVDITILNAGLFLRPLLEGEVTEDDLHQILPHPMRVLKCTLNGKDFIELIQSIENQRNELRSLPLKGLGFRGEVFGEICYKGIFVDEENIYVGQEPIDVNKNYTFATVDNYLFSPFFQIIERKGENEILFPYFLRTVVGNYLSNKYPAGDILEK